MVLVMGVEKLTKFGGGTLPLEKEDFEVTHGLVMPALYGMRHDVTCMIMVLQRSNLLR